MSIDVRWICGLAGLVVVGGCSGARHGSEGAAPQPGPPAARSPSPPAAPSSACRLLANGLSAARRTGAIERVLGLHPFLLTRTWYDAEGEVTQRTLSLMTYRVALDEAEGTLEVLVRVRLQGHGGGARIRYVHDLDDGLLLRMEGVRGVAAVVMTPTIMVTRGGEEVAAHPLDDTVLPKIVGTFLLPQLHDQVALPERIPFRDLSPFGNLNPLWELRTLTPGADPGVLVFETEEGKATTRVEVLAGGERRGFLRRFSTTGYERLPSGEKRIAAVWASERISAEEHRRLTREWFPD